MNEQRNQQADNPRTVHKFCSADNQYGKKSDDRAQAVDCGLVLPAGRFRPYPMQPHAGLGQGEGSKHADRVKRQQQMCFSVKNDDSDRGGEAQKFNAV